MVFPVSVFIWYKYYGEEYSIEEEVSCKELLMYGYCIDINHLIERTLLISGIVFKRSILISVQDYWRKIQV